MNVRCRRASFSAAPVYLAPVSSGKSFSWISRSRGATLGNCVALLLGTLRRPQSHSISLGVRSLELRSQRTRSTEKVDVPQSDQRHHFRDPPQVDSASSRSLVERRARHLLRATSNVTKGNCHAYVVAGLGSFYTATTTFCPRSSIGKGFRRRSIRRVGTSFLMPRSRSWCGFVRLAGVLRPLRTDRASGLRRSAEHG